MIDARQRARGTVPRAITLLLLLTSLWLPPQGHSAEEESASSQTSPSSGALFLSNSSDFSARFDGPGEDSTTCSTAIGDISGDRVDDLVIGACKASDGKKEHSGSVYIIYGKSDSSHSDGSLDLDSLRANRRVQKLKSRADVVISGGQTDGEFGNSVAANGDFNGDGIGDLAIGAPNNPGDCLDKGAASFAPTCPVGAVLVFYGGSELLARGFIDLARFSELLSTYRDDFTEIKGNTTGSSSSDPHHVESAGGDFGSAVSFVSDQNGDRKDELVASDPDYGSTGAAWVVFGRKRDSADLMVGSDYAAGDDSIGDECEGDFPGETGCDGEVVDLFHGTPGDVGARYTYKVDDTFSRYTTAVRTMAKRDHQGHEQRLGYQLTGSGFYSHPYSVAGGGDVNGDGRGDVVIGDVTASPSERPEAGSAYVIFGKADNGELTLKSSALNPNKQGYEIAGESSYAWTGYSVAIASDAIGNDGLADVVIGAPFAGDDYQTAPGKAYVVPGGQDNQHIDLAKKPYEVVEISGATQRSHFGESVASLGDLNHDGSDDLLISAPHATDPILLELADQAGDSFDEESGVAYAIYALNDFFNAQNAFSVESSQAPPSIRIAGAAGCSTTTDEDGSLNGSCQRNTDDTFGDHLGGSNDRDETDEESSELQSLIDGVLPVSIGDSENTGSSIPDSSSSVETGPSRKKFTSFGHDYWGQQQLAAGDLNADGTPDIALNAPGFDTKVSDDGGAAYVVLGRFPLYKATAGH